MRKSKKGIWIAAYQKNNIYTMLRVATKRGNHSSSFKSNVEENEFGKKKSNSVQFSFVTRVRTKKKWLK